MFFARAIIPAPSRKATCLELVLREIRAPLTLGVAEPEVADGHPGKYDGNQIFFCYPPLVPVSAYSFYI